MRQPTRKAKGGWRVRVASYSPEMAFSKRKEKEIWSRTF
jgi:hypothetical protein